MYDTKHKNINPRKEGILTEVNDEVNYRNDTTA